MSMQGSKRRFLVLALMTTLSAAVTVQAGGKPTATVTCTDDGIAVAEVAAGQQFTISGTGFKRGAQLALCVELEGCTYPKADSDGTFSQGRTLYKVGTQRITVSEVANRWTSYRQRASSSITVTD